MRTSSQYASSGDLADGDDRRTRGSGWLSFLVRAAIPVALITLLVGYVAYTRSAERPESYSAKAQVVLSSSTNFSPIQEGFGGSNPDRYAENQAEIMTTVEVLDLAAAILADGVTGSELRNSISTSPVAASDVIVVTGEAEDPALAARRADAVANAYAQFNTAQVTALADQAAQAVAANPDEVLRIRARAATFGDGVQVIQPASVPTSPSSPTPGRDAYLAAAAAFLLSSALAISWRARRRPSGPDQLAADAGGPFVGDVAVPWSGAALAPSRLGDYAMALQALRYRLRDGAPQTFLLTDVGRGAGTTSVVLGMAAAAAAQGRRVAVVDATSDGRLLRRVGATAPIAAVTDLVTRPAALEEVLRRIPEMDVPGGGSVHVAHVRGEAVIADDVLESSLAALLGSFDIVLVDGGRLERSAAAFALVGPVGAVAAVVPGKRGGKQLQELRQRLALAGRECAGVIATRRDWVPRSERSVPPPTAGRSQAPPPPPERGSSPATGSTVTAGRPS